MKPLVLILSLLVLFLNSIPCCVVDACAEEIAPEKQTAHEEEEEACGNCSPFIHCGTCGGFLFSSEIPVLPLQELVYGTADFELQEFPHSEYISRIWQPPQFI